jgi:DNA (cytosine-5)-methyltransferase 1
MCFKLTRCADSEPEITEIASSASSATPTTANSKNDIARFRKLHAEDSIRAPYAEIQRYKLNKGSVIKPGDTVELRDHSAHESDLMHSGDFVRIKKIIINLETDEVRLRGHRLRRTKYLGQIFDCK